jgi:NAD(P)-dependent dehydrogenase (short-subunit alcohol dehydrogenase family)
VSGRLAGRVDGVNELDLAYGSISGVTGVRGQPKLAHSAAKARLARLTRQFAAEGAPHNVRVNTLTPGVIDTDSVTSTTSPTPACSGPPASRGT